MAVTIHARRRLFGAFPEGLGGVAGATSVSVTVAPRWLQDSGTVSAFKKAGRVCVLRAVARVRGQTLVSRFPLSGAAGAVGFRTRRPRPVGSSAQGRPAGDDDPHL
ncbi:hypothetical protein [Catellatospora sichuanensis]|uniref:hypothetical protein n=1 Tax=Catellatospora sichuanensis TaxID=1969805 RepID=UPI00118449C8|nr:hypothetical protein [Catellatospora sichuanensis]